MILVTVGNATQGFRRLLEPIDDLAKEGFFNPVRVFMQTGHIRDFKPIHCEYKDFLEMDEFLEFIENSDLIICHGGCGTLLHALRIGKVPVAMPRRKRYGEHVNDHQVQLVNALASEYRVVPAYEPEDLPKAIAEARLRNRQPVPPPPSRMLSLVAQAIEELIGKP